MDDIIVAIEYYARLHGIPIMQSEGIRLLQKLIQKHRVKSILEIGSAIGYSAIQMARLDPSIKITTIEKDEQRYERAVDNIAACRMEDQIELILGDGLEYVPKSCYDLIFIDAAKAKYQQFFERFSPWLSKDGIIVSDNMKFHGLVEDPSQIKTRGTRKLVQRLGEYQEYLRNHAFFETEFLDEGDGVAVSRRRFPQLSDLQAVIFDMDGTLLDTERHFIDQCLKFNASLPSPLPLDDDYFQSIIGKSKAVIRPIFENRFGHLIGYDEFHSQLSDNIMKSLEEDGVPVKAGAITLLELLSRQGIKLGLATSTYQEKAKRVLDRAGLLPYFDVIVGGDMVAYSKPHPAIFQETARQLGVLPSKTLVIEDSNPGVKSAALGGFGTVMVVDLIAPAKKSEILALHIASSLDEVIKMF